MQKKNNRITILILAILVFLDISITYFIKKQDNSFTFSKIKVFNEDIYNKFKRRNFNL